MLTTQEITNAICLTLSFSIECQMTGYKSNSSVTTCTHVLDKTLEGVDPLAVIVEDHLPRIEDIVGNFHPSKESSTLAAVHYSLVAIDPLLYLSLQHLHR
jgi:hypothetical protein